MTSSERSRASHVKVSSSSEVMGMCRDVRSIPDTISYLINLAIYLEFYKLYCQKTIFKMALV